MRNLNCKGNGEYTYDYVHDILLFKIKNRDYLKSIDFDNIVADIDTKGYITGLRIFDASKLFGMPKLSLKNVREFRFEIQVEDKVITIKLNFTSILRNRPIIQQGQNLVREATNSDIENSQVLCTVY